MAGVDPKAETLTGGLMSKKPYEPPSWASHLSPIPSHTYSLARLPTPIHKWNLPNLPEDIEVWIKRDDLTEMQLSGNKVRKLEFLMAEALAQGADCVLTVGDIQSNHCRATAVAAKYLNLDCYLLLHHSSKLLEDEDPGLAGNLLVERLVGAHIDLVADKDYFRIGREVLLDLLKTRLIKEGRQPYVIPLGGSTSLATWGYIEAVREIEQQIQEGDEKIQFDDIVVACGSGATTAGLSLGSWLSNLKAKVHAFSVCDSPGYFYNKSQGLIDGLQAGLDIHDIATIEDAQGIGYGFSTIEELKTLKEIAATTGVILDTVYSGKAAVAMLKDMNENPTKWRGRKVLFIHTGGLLGLYAKADQMALMSGKCRRMELDETIPRVDGTGKMF